jgi:hypothetical protein
LDTAYEVYRTNFKTAVSTSTASITGLSAGTTYSFMPSKDVAGNASANSTTPRLTPQQRQHH